MPPISPASASTQTQHLVKSLYRTCLRWTQLPIVHRSKFIMGDSLPPELQALTLNLLPKQLTNQEGIHTTIKQLFRDQMGVTDPAQVSEKINTAFEGLRYLNAFTKILENAEARREANRDREGISFRVGQVVRHRLFNYRGVIVGWDRRPAVDVKQWEGVLQAPSGDEQPFYHVVPDAQDTLHFLGGNRKMMYVAQENLKLCDTLESRIHSEVIPHAFLYYNVATGAFVPQERIAWQYPADAFPSSVFPTSSFSTPSSSSSRHHRKMNVSVQRAKLVDASRKMERHLRDLASKILLQLETRYGILDRFEFDTSASDGGSGGAEHTHTHTQQTTPLAGVLALLKQLKEGHPPTSSSSSPSPSPSLAHPHHHRPKRALLSGTLEEVLPGYDALRAFRDLHSLTDDLHACRSASSDRTNVLFRCGQVVRHKTLGYRGVIVGWERFPKQPFPASDSLAMAEAHPHYRVIVNEQDRDSPSTPAGGLVVLPQEMVEGTSVEEAAVVSPLILESFEYFDPLVGRYMPNAVLRFKFPADFAAVEGERGEGGGKGGGEGENMNKNTSNSNNHTNITMVTEKIVTGLVKILRKVLLQVRNKQGNLGMKADLFTLLQGAMRKEDADVVENILWNTWLVHEKEDIRIYIEDGVNFMLRGKYDEAVARFDAALAQDPSFTEAYNKRGTSHFLSRRYPASRIDVLQTLAREPNHFGAMIGKGLILYEEGDKESAIKAFRQTLRVHPWSSNVGTTLFHTMKQREEEEGGGGGLRGGEHH